jgi:hypothetical protein
MGSVVATFMRGMLGVVVTMLVVALVWTLYVKRDAVLAASAPIVGLVTEHESPAEPRASTDPPAPTAPVGTGRGSDTGTGRH